MKYIITILTIILLNSNLLLAADSLAKIINTEISNDLSKNIIDKKINEDTSSIYFYLEKFKKSNANDFLELKQTDNNIIILKAFLEKIKNKDIDTDFKNELNQIKELDLKIKTNQTYNYTSAVERDKLKIMKLTLDIEFKKLIQNLYLAHNNFKDKVVIQDKLDILKSSLKNLNLNEFKLEDSSEKIINLKNEALIDLKEEVNALNIIIFFIEKNIDLLVKENIFNNYINIDKVSEKINNYYYLSDLNSYTNLLIKIDFGRLIIGLLFVCLIILLQYILLPLAVKIIKPYYRNLKNRDTKNTTELIAKSLKNPLKFLALILSLNVFSEIVLAESYNIESLRLFESISYWFIIGWIIKNFVKESLFIFADDIFVMYPAARGEMLLFLNRLANFFLSIMIIAVILAKLGVNLTVLVGSLGFIGIGASLAFKDTFANFLGSINILFDKSFSVGDHIEINGTEGTVVEIGMRKTRLRGLNNGEYTIPNATLSNGTVLNWSNRELGRQIKIELKLKYKTNEDQLINIVNDIKDMLSKHEDIANDLTELNQENRYRRNLNLIKHEDDKGIKKTLLVNVDKLNDNSIDILILCFTETTEWEDWLKIKQDIILKTMDIVKKHKAEFYYVVQNEIN